MKSLSKKKLQVKIKQLKTKLQDKVKGKADMRRQLKDAETNAEYLENMFAVAEEKLAGGLHKSPS